MTVLFLHGSFSSPADIWWPWLKSELENLGHKVFTPQFPVDKWAEVDELKPEEYRPSADLNIWFNKFEKFDNLNSTFLINQFDWEKIRNNCRNFSVYRGDNDPYVPLAQAKTAADNLKVKLQLIPNGGHLNTKAGYDKFPQILDEIKKCG